MSITIPASYTRGNRVRVLGGLGIPNEIIGQTAVVVGTYGPDQPFVVMDDPNLPKYSLRNDGSWVITGWERIDPTIGDTVTAVDVPGRADYDGKTAKVTEVQSDGCILGEFQSLQKPDDTEMFGFYEWEPIEYTPTLHDTVRMTGYLAIDGIRTVNDWIGEVVGIDNGVWTVIVEGTEYPSGPGYVFPVKDGETLTVSNRDPRSYAEINIAMQQKVDELTRELERANERVVEYGNRAGKWERDFMRSWERIAREAVSRSWCSEYEQIVDEVQEDLEIGEIPARRRRVRKQMRIRAEVYRDVWVWVDEDAGDDEDPDNWYESEADDEDDNLGSEWADDQIRTEYHNVGFDSVEYKSI